MWTGEIAYDARASEGRAAMSRTSIAATETAATSSSGVARRLLGALALSGALVLSCTPRETPGSVATGEPGASAIAEAPGGGALPATPATLVPAPLRGVSVLTLRLERLPALTSGHYEAWALLDNDRVSAGKFNVGRDGELVALGGAPIAAFPLTRDIIEARRVLVSIEPEGDRDATPSDLLVLEGSVVNGRAVLGFPISTTGFGGSAILASPTDDNPGNETAGAWFAAPETRGPTLSLAAPPAGWVYEGWIRTQDRLFTVGRFTRGQGADSAVLTSGPRPGFDTPGEDLLERLGAPLAPINLADGNSAIEVSLEPDRAGQDPTGAGMFTAPVLRAQIPAGTAPGQAIPLEADPGQLPSGVATLG
ncbi:MAG: hypothetical protein IT299_08215 [Dehalococcoidia bacterium]|nr:hypothetical protein [Dehalococcoidia bacterium]